MPSSRLSFGNTFKLLFLLFVGLLAASALSAWTGPTATAPGGNIAAPINVGTTDQVKNAGLSLNALTVFGSQYIQDELGIGRPSPVVALDVNGTLRIASGGEVCQAVTEGGVRYNNSIHKLEYCNGTTWGAVDSTNPTGITSCRICSAQQDTENNGPLTWTCSAYSSGNTFQYPTAVGFHYGIQCQ